MSLEISIYKKLRFRERRGPWSRPADDIKINIKQLAGQCLQQCVAARPPAVRSAIVTASMLHQPNVFLGHQHKCTN